MPSRRQSSFSLKVPSRRQSSQKLFRKSEDKMAMIFLSITLLFIICHSPRLILDIHELITSDYAKQCKKVGIRYLPNVWTFVMIYIRDNSHITSLLFTSLPNLISPFFNYLPINLRSVCAFVTTYLTVFIFILFFAIFLLQISTDIHKEWFYGTRPHDYPW